MVKDLIMRRKSVRTYDKRPLSAEDMKCLKEYISSLENPFRVPVDFRILDANEYGLSSPVIIGADTYLAAKVKKVRDFEIACGYSFEKACLFALERGIGTVMLAASLSRKAFEKAMEVGADEVLPVASPIGYPAEKRSVRENLMRKGLKADERAAFAKLFFDGNFDKGLTADRAGIYADALEMARWAPSAANRQPWRAVVSGDRVDFYEAKSMKDSELGDIQKFDVGIAIAHFDMTLKEAGVTGTFVHADPGLAVPDNVRYVISYERNK